MTLFETAIELQLRLEAASTADKEDVLLSRAQNCARRHRGSKWSTIEAVSVLPNHVFGLHGPAAARHEGDPSSSRPSSRGALSRSSDRMPVSSGPQQILRDVLAEQTRRVDHWIKSTWGEELRCMPRRYWIVWTLRVTCTDRPQFRVEREAQNRASKNPKTFCRT